MEVPLNHRDIARLTAHFPEAELTDLVRMVPADSTDPDALKLENSWRVLSLPNHGPEKGCKFLKENQCSIYRSRPTACQNFPLRFNKEKKLEVAPEHFLLYELACDKTPMPQSSSAIQALKQNEREFKEYRRLVKAWNLRVGNQIEKQTLTELWQYLKTYS